MAKQISFKVSKADRVLLDQIVARAMRKYPDLDRQSVAMDLAATHANGCRLDLGKLLAADDFNFAHDVFGIARHLDRTTGALTGLFLPRTSAPKKALRGRASRADKKRIAIAERAALSSTETD